MFAMVPDALSPHDPVVQILIALLVVLGISIAILVGTFLASRWASHRLEGWLRRSGFQENVAILLGRAVWAAIWAIGVLIVLRRLGIGFAPLTAFIGVVGLAASLSLQQVLQNLVAGVYLLAERPFGIGDVVNVVGPAGLNHSGRVEDIEMRTTHLRSADDELILVPNSALFTGVLTNRTVTGGYALRVSLTLPRKTDLDDVRSHLLDIVSGSHLVLAHPAPSFRLQSVAADTWTACVTYWAETLDVATGVLWAIAQAFPDATLNDGEAQS